jgi:hypothetical protein
MEAKVRRMSIPSVHRNFLTHSFVERGKRKKINTRTKRRWVDRCKRASGAPKYPV